MSCVRESSPQPEHVSSQRPEPKRRRFHPLRGLRRIFRRKAPSPEPNEVKSSDDVIEPPGLDTSRCRSTSQLIDEPFTRRRSLHSTLLSVSHDSVFNPEQHSGQSDSESTVSVPRLGFPQANIQAELIEAVRRRRKIQNDDDSDVDEEDLGLPRSPSMHSPTIATGNDLLLSKELITKSSHSTCSDGSLLSMGSSEMDEDSFGPQNSRYSSKISLHDNKRTSQTYPDSSDGDSSTSVPLSHSAAKHRMAIRPKRKHGNPRNKNPLTVTTALPATPEVNEEHSGRSTSPETNAKSLQTAAAVDITTDGTITTTTDTSTTTFTIITTVTSNNTTTTTITTTTSVAAIVDNCTIVDADDGATAVGSCDLDTSVDEISVENVPRREEGFFHRLLSRRSTKKKTLTTKCSSAEDVDVDTFLFDETMSPKPRQREEPPPAGRMQLSYPPDLPPDTHPHHRDVTTVAENIFASGDTFVPIKRSFSIGQPTAGDADDDLTSCSGGGESSLVQKSSSSDSVSSTALDDSTVSVVVEPAVAVAGDERRQSYSSSDSEHLMNGVVHQHHHHRPIPAPRPSKLYNGGGGTTDVVMRRKKRDDLQQPELFKVFARRSLKLGKDGEPELLLTVGGGGGSSCCVDDDDDDDEDENDDGDDEDDYGDKEDNDYEMRAVENSRVTATDDKSHRRESDVDVNENRTATTPVVEVVPQFKRIQQRREEWEKLLQQQRN